MKLVATKRQRFNAQDLSRGDVFYATNSYGRILIKRKMATLYVEPQQEKPKRQYNRRDMVVEDAS